MVDARMDDTRMLAAMNQSGLPKAVLDTTVVLVGAGSLGSRVGALSIQMGVGRLVVVDNDTVEAKDRVQGAYLTGHLGWTKPRALESKAREVGSRTEVIPLEMDGRLLGPGALGGVDLVISALDRLPIRLDLYASVFEAGVPYLDLGVDGGEGRITESVGDGACYHCHQDLTDWSRDEVAEHRFREFGCRAQADPGRPTIANPFVITEMAGAGIGLALHMLAGRGRGQEHRLSWGTGVPVWRRFDLVARPACPTCEGRGAAGSGPDPAIRRVAESAGTDSLGTIESHVRDLVGPGALDAPQPWSKFGQRPPKRLWENVPASRMGVPYGGRLRFAPETGDPVIVQLSDDLTEIGGLHASQLEDEV